MIGPIVKFLLGFCFPFIIVVPEINPTSYWWPWLIGFISAKICIDCKGELNKISGQARLSSSSLSCFVMFMQSNPVVSKTCRYVVLSFVNCFSHACRSYMFYQWRPSLCVSEWWRFLCFVRTGDVQSATTQSPLVTNVGQLNGHLSGSRFMFHAFRSAARILWR